jgi:class 3 adenylate cyclase/tRNA A-37 threonylcarbamoyl transferase component Bud32
MKRILLVERDPTLRKWFRLHLTARGFTVVAFDDGRRALEAAQRELPDLLLIATDLPANEAFALAAGLRSNVRTSLIPILFMVPANDPVALAQAASIEPQGVVKKPLTHAVLLESVAARLGAKDPMGLHETAPAPAPRGTAPIGGALPASVVGSGLLLDVREASVLVVMLRNFVSLARSLSAKSLDALLRQFLAAAREAVVDQDGWIVRADATGLIALFEEGPRIDRTHATRAIEAALGVVLAARRAKKWAESEAPNASMPDLSVGCGVHAGEVIIARLSGSGYLALTVAGQTAELAQRLDGRAKGLGWSLAASESAISLAGSRFHIGRRANLTDTDSDVTIPIAEVLGFNPGTAKPGELSFMAEVGEAVLANTMLARLAGDIDQHAADRTIMVSAKRRAEIESASELPQRRIEHKIGNGRFVNAYVALQVATDRKEIVKTLRLRDLPPAFIERYLDEYRKIADLDQRNVLTVLEVGQTTELAYVATEFLAGGALTDAIRKKLPVGLALSCVAQMCMGLKAIHDLGIVHGALRAQHFLFREDRVLVLADFNTSDRVSALLGLVQVPGHDIGSRGQAEPGECAGAGTRADFHALGRIMHEMVTGETTLNARQIEGVPALDLFEASRLPLPLSPLQSCLDGLLGIGADAPFECAEDVLAGLLTLNEVFPFGHAVQRR